MIAGFLNLKSKRLPVCKTFLCALHEHASLGGILNLEFVSLPFQCYFHVHSYHLGCIHVYSSVHVCPNTDAYVEVEGVHSL